MCNVNKGLNVLLSVCVFQAEGRVGGSGGESPAAADRDNSGDAGGPAGRRRDSREEEPGRLGRYTSTATLQELQFTRKKNSSYITTSEICMEWCIQVLLARSII